jgi:membrane protease YdiL (CAAX protease family)
MNIYDNPPEKRINYVAKLLVLIGIFIISSQIIFPMLGIAIASRLYNIPWVDALQVLLEPQKIENGMNAYSLIQGISNLGGFLGTAFVFLLAYRHKPIQYLKLNQSPNFILLISSVLIIASNFSISSFLGGINYSIPLDSLGELGAMIQRTEAKIKEMTELILEINTPLDFIFKIVIVALIPAVAEEVFFRGLLQKFIWDWTGKPYRAILISALIFAVLHFRFTHLLPIFYMGLLFGYVYFKTGNLYYTILLHFINNATVVVVYYFIPSALDSPALQDSYIPGLEYMIPSLLVFGLGLYLLHKKTNSIQDTVFEDGGADE